MEDKIIYKVMFVRTTDARGAIGEDYLQINLNKGWKIHRVDINKHGMLYILTGIE